MSILDVYQVHLRGENADVVKEGDFMPPFHWIPAFAGMTTGDSMEIFILI